MLEPTTLTNPQTTWNNPDLKLDLDLAEKAHLPMVTQNLLFHLLQVSMITITLRQSQGTQFMVLERRVAKLKISRAPLTTTRHRKHSVMEHPRSRLAEDPKLPRSTMDQGLANILTNSRPSAVWRLLVGNCPKHQEVLRNRWVELDQDNMMLQILLPNVEVRKSLFQRPIEELQLGMWARVLESTRPSLQLVVAHLFP